MLLLFSFVLLVEEFIYSDSFSKGSASSTFSSASFSFSKSIDSFSFSSPLKLNYWLIALVICKG
jgi:hypothetical protein